MFKKIVVIFLLSLPVIMAMGQDIIILDRGSNNAVEGVAIYTTDHSNSSLSNKFGKANLDSFKMSDTLIFQHPSFVLLILPKEVVCKEGTIFLEKRSYSLNQVTISANRYEEDPIWTPIEIATVKQAEIALENPQTAADVLSYAKGVYVQKSQLGGGSPMIRGLSANKVLIVVDGVRMNNAIFRSGNLHNVIVIDPNSLDFTEVLFGPGSVIYGSDALGGVMDFHTKTPILSNNDTLNFSVNGLARWSSANGEKTIHFDMIFGWEKFGSYTGVSFSDYDNLFQGKNGGSDKFERDWYVNRFNGSDSIVKSSNPSLQRYSNYGQMNIIQKFVYKPNDDLSLNYGFYYSSTSDIPRYDRLTQTTSNGDPKYATWDYGPQEWLMNTLSANYSKPTIMFSNMKILAAYQRFNESRFSRKFNNFKISNRYENVDVCTINFDFNKTFSEKLSLFYGFEGVYNYVDSHANGTFINSDSTSAVSTRYPDGGSNYYSSGLYLTSRWNISKITTLSGGFRYSYTNLNSKFNDTTFFKFPYKKISLKNDALTASLGLVHYPIDELKISTNLASGFRAPNLDDVAKVFDSEPGRVVVPNPNLEPEKSYNIDISLAYTIGKSTTIGATGFYTFLENVIVRSDFTFNGQDSIMYDGEMSKVQAMTNAGKGYVYGTNLFFQVDIWNYFAIRSDLTYQYGRDGDNNPLRHVTPLFGSTGLQCFWKNLTGEIYANYNGEKPFSEMPPSEIDKAYLYAENSNGDPYTAAWWTLNLKASYRIIDELTLNVGVENILNKLYRPYSSGISAPGRNFIIALRVNL